MKKILFICPFSLETNHAGVVYTRQLLKRLSETCIVDIIVFHYKGDMVLSPFKNANIIRSIEINSIYKVIGVLSLFWVFPLFSARFNWNVCGDIKKLVTNIDYDFIYFDFSQSFAYSLFIKHPHKILMAHDVMAQKYSRMKKYLRPWAVRSEKSILKQGSVFTFSEKDCQIIKNLYNISSSPTTFFLSPEVQNATPSGCDNYYVFFGGWIREENHEALEWYIDKVNPLAPSIKYKVIGGGLPKRIEDKLPANFEYLGFVDNPYPIIANAKAEIAPLRKGAGVKVKCIDALGCGTLVIGTDVAFEGIPSEYKDFMILADSESDYLRAVTTLEVSIDERIKFKRFFIETYNQKTILSYIEGSYQ